MIATISRTGCFQWRGFASKSRENVIRAIAFFCDPTENQMNT